MENKLMEMPEDLRQRLEGAIRAAREILAEDEMSPITMIGIEEGKEVAMLPWGSLPDTDMATNVIRSICVQTNAAWVITVMECYTLTREKQKELPDVDDFRRQLKKYGSIKDMPGSVAAVTFMVETHDKSWVAIAEQQPLEGGNGHTFGELEFIDAMHQEGRFVGLLGSGGRTRQ